MSGEFDDLPTATEYVVDPEVMLARHEGFEKDIEYAKKAHTHLWTVMVTFRLSDDMAEKMARGMNLNPQLDRENIVNVGVGCYMCEKELDPRLIGKRCKAVNL